MLNRLTVSALLKTVILVTSFCLVIGFSLNVKQASKTLETQSQHLGNQVTEFLGKIRAA